jgi:hypothetical protein
MFTNHNNHLGTWRPFRDNCGRQRLQLGCPFSRVLHAGMQPNQPHKSHPMYLDLITPHVSKSHLTNPGHNTDYTLTIYGQHEWACIHGLLSIHVGERIAYARAHVLLFSPSLPADNCMHRPWLHGLHYCYLQQIWPVRIYNLYQGGFWCHVLNNGGWGGGPAASENIHTKNHVCNL